jgi:probable phosphoglycerate mutase
MKIYLIRHGEIASSGKTYAGRSNVPLNERGHGQARRIARDFSGNPIALILPSPLSRAVDTARPLAASLGLDPIEDPALMEIDFGVYEGHPKDALGPKLRKSYAVTPIPGGESLMDVWTRAGHVLEFLETFHLPPTSQIALFGHFWINPVASWPCLRDGVRRGLPITHLSAQDRLGSHHKASPAFPIRFRCSPIRLQ